MSITEIGWKGPRPLAPGDILKGRESDLITLVNKARSSDVIEITAASGVGKSSFIAAGLAHQLQKAGYRILPEAEDWSWSKVLTQYDAESGDEDDIELLYRLCLGWEPAADDTSIEEQFEALREKGRLVVVLDQFEELIRYRDRLGADFLAFIGETASDFKVTHIVAARSEYRDRFRPMEDACDNFFHWPLPEIDKKAAVDAIIDEPVKAAGLEIDPEATAHLRKWWLLARDRQPTELMSSIVGRAEVGLLHLQGVLWLFQRWLVANVPDDTTTITLDHVKQFARAYVGGSDDETATRLYHRALVEYVRVVCDSLHDADTGIEQWEQERSDGVTRWTNGPRLMMAKSAHLFSVLGYKVAQSRSGMFQTVLAEDLEPSVAREVAATAAASTSDGWLAETAREHGPKGIQGRGLALGWEGEAVLAELLAACTQAWSAASVRGANILRRFVQSDEDVYELVHDGMGHALQEWAREELLKPRSVMGVITQRAGKSLHLPLVPATFVDGDVVPAYWEGFASLDDTGAVTVRGLGWDASLIASDISDAVIDEWTLTGALFHDFERGSSTLQDVVFRRCDFAGAAFRLVTLKNVRFEQCRLHGATMDRCTLDGVEFVHTDDEKDRFPSLDLFSFVECKATGAGVTMRSMHHSKGLLVDRVSGGPWHLEGDGVRHVDVSTEDKAAVFTLGPGSYSHLTVSPRDLPVQTDAAAVIDESSEITVVGR